MAETVGSLIDKLTIVELRRWHTEEAMYNPQAPADVRHTAAVRLRIIDEQRQDLIDEVSTLWRQIVAGHTPPKVYRQFKLYNDAAMRTASQAGAAVAGGEPEGGGEGKVVGSIFGAGAAGKKKA